MLFLLLCSDQVDFDLKPSSLTADGIVKIFMLDESSCLFFPNVIAIGLNQLLSFIISPRPLNFLGASDSEDIFKLQVVVILMFTIKLEFNLSDLCDIYIRDMSINLLTRFFLAAFYLV